MKLQRHPDNPVLQPDPTSAWETYNVYNPSVIYHNGLFHMHYRAQGVDWVSRIGYAVSADGVHWNRLREPVVAPSDEWETRGVEDPRVTAIDGVFYIAAYASLGITPMYAQSSNLIEWERIGPVVTGEDNKDHALFPERIGGRYVTFHRRPPQIWLAYSEDLKKWTGRQVVMGPREGNGWENTRIGAGGTPIKTEHGWLIIYHGYDQHTVYSLGVALLDLDDPTHVIRRPRARILWPEEIWEMLGHVRNVVFACANPVVDGTVYVYYGGADHVVGLATCALEELIDFARYGEE